VGVRGSALIAVMIHAWIVAGIYGYSWTLCKASTSEGDMMVIGHVIFSGMTLGLRVDQFLTSMPTLADSNMMMQLCCHNWQI
jgi:hypothetical protein